MKKIGLVGRRFGRLVVISEQSRNKWGQVIWECLCDCGNKTTPLGMSLKNGNTKSCGCLSKDVPHHITHGMSRTPIYRVWASIIGRCYSKTHTSYINYGGRGITVCGRWMQFENFYADMGERPKGLTIERIDNGKGYYPDNCKWATRKDQARNTRRNRLVSYGGKKQCLIEWAEELGISQYALKYRLDRYPPQIAFNM